MQRAARMPQRSETDEERRRRRRALIRAHHPDRGGDPAEFIRLLHHLDQERPLGASYPEMSFVHRRRWWQVAVSISLLRRTSRRPKRVV
jgi:hypothetical protein